MTAATTIRVTRGKLSRLAHAGLDSFAFRERAIGDLRAALPFDAAAWWTIDPASALFTSCVFQPSPVDHAICAGVHGNELGDTDYNKFRVLARRSAKAEVLSAATGGQPERSDRYRHILAPLQYKHELRLALSDNSVLWGGIALLREPGGPDFTPAEVGRVASLGRILTEGLRSGIALGAAQVDCAPNGPGMLIVDDDLQILTMTPNAERWLDELTDGFPCLPNVGSSWLPEAVRSVVARARQPHGGDAPEDHMSRARVRGSSGRWLAIYASRTRETRPGSASIAVIIEEARPAEIAPLIMDAYGLSPREARVTSLVLHGLSTREIADEIHLSPYTVQDHLKAIFEKAGVRSRRVLAARVFGQYHLPRAGLGGNPPESDGAVAGAYSTVA
ncbi:MAG TPA: helix-turn-helix transcriptional regulator [Trebonia sp.]|nr:helix-turn-helix transcriptional regulator [Trebonia sp.]